MLYVELTIDSLVMLRTQLLLILTSLYIQPIIMYCQFVVSHQSERIQNMCAQSWVNIFRFEL